MDQELQEISILLKKVFPKLLENPKIMTGCDISEEEIQDIKKTKTLSLEVLQHVAGDCFFFTYNEELNISEKEGEEIDNFLFRSAPHFLEDLKEQFSYLKE